MWTICSEWWSAVSDSAVLGHLLAFSRVCVKTYLHDCECEDSVGPGRYHKEQHAGWCIKYSKPDLILRLFSLLHPELCEHFVQLRVETAWCWSLTPVLQWHSLHFMFPAGSLLTEQFCYVQLQSVTNVHSGQTIWDDLVFRTVPDTHSQWWQNNVSSSFQN